MPVSVGDDVVRFDRAYDNSDIAEFVRLCDSTCEVSERDEHKAFLGRPVIRWYYLTILRCQLEWNYINSIYFL